MNVIKQSVKKYYSEVLKNSKDLKSTACCVTSDTPAWILGMVNNISEQVLEKFYGCGFPITEAVEGCTVLDLGCGTGRDVYIYSQLVGPTGKVIGIDMTPEQLSVAQDVMEEQRIKFNHQKSNVEFILADIENLQSLNLQNKINLVISNCVVNLTLNKPLIFNEVAKVLIEGGEFYFSDIFCDRRLNESIKNNEMLYGECLAGSLYINDFLKIAKESGFRDPRLVSESLVQLSPEITKLTGTAQFFSRTYRLFKIADLEDKCEDYGQTAEYLGNIPYSPHLLKFDQHHFFETGRPERICGNTAEMLMKSRFTNYFKISGDKKVHFGEFNCGDTIATKQYQNSNNGSSCC